MKVFVVDKDDFEGVNQQLQEAKDEIERVTKSEEEETVLEEMEPKGPPFGIVINGHSLVSTTRQREREVFHCCLVHSAML